MFKIDRKLVLGAYCIALVVLVPCIFLGTISINLAVVLALIGAAFIYLRDKKQRQQAFLGIGALLVMSSLIIGWPLRYALPIDGRVVDKATGEPVESAIFEVEWWASYASVGGASGKLVDRTYAVSGKDGEYRIAGRLSFPLDPGGYGLTRIVKLRHPLYETAMFDDMGRIIDFIEINRIRMTEKIRPHISITSKDFKLLKLEDKYKASGKVNSACDVLDGINEFSPYIRTAILAGVCKTIDLKNVPTAFNKLLLIQPDHYCKTMGLKIVEKWREEVERHGIFTSIGMYWVELYRTPGFRQQSEQAEVLKHELSKGCYE